MSGTIAVVRPGARLCRLRLAEAVRWADGARGGTECVGHAGSVTSVMRSLAGVARCIRDARSQVPRTSTGFRRQLAREGGGALARSRALPLASVLCLPARAHRMCRRAYSRTHSCSV